MLDAGKCAGVRHGPEELGTKEMTDAGAVVTNTWMETIVTGSSGLRIGTLCVCVYVRVCACVCWVVQSCPTLCNTTEYNPPGSSVCRILQARILEWVAISYFRGFSGPRDWTLAPASPEFAGRFFTAEPPGKLLYLIGRVWSMLAALAEFLGDEFGGSERLVN